VVVIGVSAGIGFETGRLARGEGARVILTGRNPDRLRAAAGELAVEGSAAFDAGDPALELAPIRVNLIAPGLLDTPLSASMLGDQLEARRNQLRTSCPSARGAPADVDALAVHVMTNTALTGATYDIDGRQQRIGI
jgi:NAD(P)-dependent dehydrogenase (short-subunit alcohol dehydrogenase family)